MKKFFLNLSYLLLGLPIGIVYFVVLSMGLSIGVGLLITLIGVPLLAGTIFMTYALADFDRLITSRMLGVQIDKPEAYPADSSATLKILVMQLRDWGFWKQFLYLILRMPLGIFTFTIAVTLVSVTIAMICAPVIVGLFPGVAIMSFGASRLDTLSEALFASMGGVVLGIAAVWVINGVSYMQGRFTRWALGR